ncbi:hypothetical protein, partial [Bordetella tumbae]|uniref:hypothetical protein n=1 Tax=Bordetella tumbae TaxID=1649139 RepID=UPI0039F0F834
MSAWIEDYASRASLDKGHAGPLSPPNLPCQAGGSRLGMFEWSAAERVCPAAPPGEAGEGQW